MAAPQWQRQRPNKEYGGAEGIFPKFGNDESTEPAFAVVQRGCAAGRAELKLNSSRLSCRACIAVCIRCVLTRGCILRQQHGLQIAEGTEGGRQNRVVHRLVQAACAKQSHKDTRTTAGQRMQSNARSSSSTSSRLK